VASRTYNCAGLRVESPVPLTAPVDDGEPDIVFVVGKPRTAVGERPLGEVIAERVVDGVPWYTFARCGGIVVARFFGLADFDIDTERRRVERGLALLARAGEALMGELDTGARLGREESAHGAAE